MALVTGLIRRTLWLLLLGLAGGAAIQWWRERQAPAGSAPPEWPPIDVTASIADTSNEATTATDDADTTDDVETDGGDSGDASIVPDAPGPTDETPARGTASVVNALVDAPEARSTGGDGAAWVAPDDDGSCPIGHPIKANDNSGIFHVPGGRFYERTKAERCYVDAEAAAADGYRQAKS